ncbi:hypothetical protein C1M59_06455 [Vibrio diazotrophicus]|nr:hypothetical protein C1M59_06455 [Vibrio diazotrophicus]
MTIPCSIYLTFTLQTVYKIINTDVQNNGNNVTLSTFLALKANIYAHYIEQNKNDCYKIVNKKYIKATHQNSTQNNK